MPVKFKTLSPVLADVIQKAIRLAKVDEQWFLDQAEIGQISDLTQDRYIPYLRWLLRIQRGEISITIKGGVNNETAKRSNQKEAS